MPKSIAILGNCQIGGIEKAINLATADLKPKSFFLASLAATYDKPRFVAEMKGFDLIYAHPSNDPQFGTEALREAGLQVREMPVIAFPAFHPDMVYAQRKLPDGGVEIMKSPVGDNHSALALYGHHLGLNPEQIARLFCAEAYQAVGFFDAWSPAWEELAAAGDRAGLPLQSMMLSWARRGIFMHTLNHPRVFVLADIARAIAKKEGCRLRTGSSDAYLVDDLITSTVWPVYPEIAARMSLEGSMLFKRAQITEFYDLEEMIRESVTIYDHAGRDNIQCWRFDLWNFLPGVREKLLGIAGVGGETRELAAV